MTINAKITTADRDAEIARHIRCADREIVSVYLAFPCDGLDRARQQLAAALALVEPTVDDVVWDAETILAREG